MTTAGPSKRLLFGVWLSLLALLFLTWLAAKANLGDWGIVAAMALAGAKALLVVLFLMHVRYSAALTWLFAAAGFFWLLILVALTMADYLTRSGFGPCGTSFFRASSQIPAHPWKTRASRPLRPRSLTILSSRF